MKAYIRPAAKTTDLATYDYFANDPGIVQGNGSSPVLGQDYDPTKSSGKDWETEAENSDDGFGW